MTAQQDVVKRATKEAAPPSKKVAGASDRVRKARVEKAALPSSAPSEQLQLFYRVVPTPVGPFALYVDADGAVRRCRWQHSAPGDAAALEEEQLQVCVDLQSRWYKELSVVMAPPSSPDVPIPGEKAATLLDQYFNPATAEAGRPEALERWLLQVPIVYPSSSHFMNTTWDVLRRTVPAGETISYKGLGLRVGQTLSRSSGAPLAPADALKAAPIAIGQAMGANPIPVIVPCHRVLSSAGGLRGYGLGLRFKVWLLRHEEAAVPEETLRELEAENAISTVASLRK